MTGFDFALVGCLRTFLQSHDNVKHKQQKIFTDPLKGETKLNKVTEMCKMTDQSPRKYQKETDFPATPRIRPSSSGSSSTVISSSTHRSSMSSRLERLATPRTSATWKKPIHSKYSQGEPSRRKSENQKRKDEIKILERSSVKSTTKSWKDHLSPKLSKLISSISPTPTKLDDEQVDHPDSSCNDSCLHDKRGQESRVPDILSMPIIASLLNHPFHSSCPPASVVKFSLIALQREVHRLTDELAVKDQCISELQAKVKENDIRQLHCREMILYREIDSDSIASSIAAVQGLGQALSPELPARRQSTPKDTNNNTPESGQIEGTGQQDDHCKTRDSVESFSPLYNGKDSFSELVLRLSEELDSKIEEIDFMKLEHDLEIEHIQKMVVCLTPSPITPLTRTKEAPDDHPEAKELVSSLNRLRKECHHLRRSSMESIRLANDELDKNYGNIMDYVHEEVESAREEEIGMLQSKLEEARSENSRLESELKEAVCKNSRLSCICATEEPSPLPTSESWSHFCMRFRQEIYGKDMFKSKMQAISCEEDEDIFVDALYSHEDNSTTKNA